jgi:hypothetical protein
MMTGTGASEFRAVQLISLFLVSQIAGTPTDIVSPGVARNGILGIHFNPYGKSYTLYLYSL